jgi:hypothetical protein
MLQMKIKSTDMESPPGSLRTSEHQIVWLEDRSDETGQRTVLPVGQSALVIEVSSAGTAHFDDYAIFSFENEYLFTNFTFDRWLCSCGVSLQSEFSTPPSPLKAT